MTRTIMIACFALVLAMEAQGQAMNDDIDAIKAPMIAAKIHQDSIDTSRLMAVYDYECKTQDADDKIVTDKMKVCVLVGQHNTRCFPYRKFLKEMEWAEGGQRTGTKTLGLDKREYMEGYDFCSPEELPLLMAESFCFMPQVWTNYPDGKMTVRDAIPPSIYETQENLKPIRWSLCEDTVTINGYLCKTAICQLHGRKWTVHYSEDIPTSAGSWKLCGLPGLILEAETEGGVHRFVISEIRNVTVPIYYETNAVTMKTTEEKLIKDRIKTFGNKSYLQSSSYYITDFESIDVVYIDKGILINGICINDRPHVFQPLELNSSQ